MLTTYTYDKANRLKQVNASGAITTYTVDLAGNPTRKQSAREDTEYSWDAAGRMATAQPDTGTVSFTYNANGQRVAKESTDASVTGYLYDQEKLLHETDDVGGDITRTYASDLTDESGNLIGEEGEYVHQYDAQANTNALTRTITPSTAMIGTRVCSMDRRRQGSTRILRISEVITLWNHALQSTG